VGEGTPVWPIADEDMDRANEDKTAAVHFLRYQLTPENIADLKGGGTVTFGVEHDAYASNPVQVAEEVRLTLMTDIG
jgi:hypothetical protein